MMALTNKPKILMVDDKPANLLALRRLLKDMPVELYEATNGNEALRLTLHHDFALALLDIQMPEMDGYELAELLRQEEKTARMPFIFISAIYTEHINIFHGYEKGAFSYIVKPFEPEILLNKVKLFIDMYQHEQALRQRTIELMQINEELEAFSYSVSHDLRAPLRAIDGFSQALLDDYEDKLDDTGRGYLARVRSGAQRMGTLIDDILNLSRVSRAELNIQQVNLSALAEEVCTELQANEPERYVNLHIASDLKAWGDRHLLRIMLENLLHNAWKYTAKREQGRIELGMKDQNGEYTFFVQDNGAGFDMRHAKNLFGAFQRLHDAAEFPGTGIGLATVKRIINRHYGRVWAEAAVDEGAVFYFTLPDMTGSESALT
ncbi:sensor histidine kinase [Methylophaga sp. OBS4]|uniref:sensor histidine kinase n=1 Tax=Methylophaga sp. OBS4 TaxID=2991935 RepID=UPI00224FA17F|nr:response regulator [Methylophaga sp. OBS4]MCX4187109.1 response regulator [Methylophaga sp. OBS4]